MSADDVFNNQISNSRKRYQDEMESIFLKIFGPETKTNKLQPQKTYIYILQGPSENTNSNLKG